MHLIRAKYAGVARAAAQMRDLALGVFWIQLLSSLSCLVFSTVTTAATVLPDTGNLPRIETQPAPSVITSPEIDKKDSPRYPAAMPENTDIKITVERFTFTGNKNVSEAELAALLSPHLGQSLSIKELNQLTALVTRYYRARGFMLAEAYFPEQEITQNSLEIAVVEGYLGEFNITSKKDGAKNTLDDTFLKRMATRDLATNDAIKESNLVRNITIINSLPAVRAVSELSPGAEVGYSNVNLELEALPMFQGYVAANTYGNRYTGREQLLAGLFLNNLAGRGDRLSLNLKNANHERQRSAQLAYALPVHASGTLLNVNAGYSDYRLGREFSILGASGRTWYTSAYVDQPMLRSRKGNITTRFGVSHKDVSDDVSAFLLENHRGINAVELGLFGDWRDSSWHGANQLGLNLKVGEVDFKNRKAQSLDDTGAKTDGNFIKYSLLASRIQPLNATNNLILRAEYQGADKNLDSLEKLAIGGVNRWREFGEIPTSSDRGLIAGAELRRAMLHVSGLASFLPILNALEASPYAFVDYGQGVLNHSALSSDNHVKSVHYGAGVDVQFAKRWVLDLTLSHQRSKIEGVDSESETRAWGQIRAEF